MTAGPLLIREELASSLRELRTARGLSLRELAARTRDEGGPVSSQAISRIELGDRSPKVVTLVALAGALGVAFRVDGDGVATLVREDDPA